MLAIRAAPAPLVLANQFRDIITDTYPRIAFSIAANLGVLFRSLPVVLSEAVNALIHNIIRVYVLHRMLNINNMPDKALLPMRLPSIKIIPINQSRINFAHQFSNSKRKSPGIHSCNELQMSNLDDKLSVEYKRQENPSRLRKLLCPKTLA